jgi:hypothetical protein
VTAGEQVSAVPTFYRFEIVLHPRPVAAVNAEEPLLDDRGRWPVLAVPPAALAEPFAVEFDAVLAALDRLPRMFTEPDGAILWTSADAEQTWQVDGTLAERSGRLLAAELKGSCLPEAFDQLLAACGWPQASVMFQLVRAGVFLDEPSFRRHAAAWGAVGAG